jgi:hypothetical protein
MPKGKKRKPQERPPEPSETNSSELRPVRSKKYLPHQPLTIFVDGSERELKSLHCFEAFEQECTDDMFDGSNVVIELSNLLYFSEPTIQVLARLSGSSLWEASYAWQGNALPGVESVFDVVMEVLIDKDDMNAYRHLRYLLIALSALSSRKQDAPLVVRIQKRLKKLGFEGDGLRELKKEERELREKFEDEIGDNREARIVDIFPDLPIVKTASAVVVPCRYLLDGRGVCDARDERIVIISAPLFIERVLESICGAYLMVSIWFKTTTGWRNRIVPRDVICDKRKLLDCAKFGLAVTNDNALEVVRFLSAFEHANKAKFAVTKMTSRLGRHEVERRLPVVNATEVGLSERARMAIKKKAKKKVASLPLEKKHERELKLIEKYEAAALEKLRRKQSAKLSKEYEYEVANDGVLPELPSGFETVTVTTFVLPDQVWSTHFVEPSIEFASSDQAIEEQVSGFRCKGELSEYVRLVRQTEDYPVVRLMVVAAFTSLLRIFLSFDNLILDICGRTTSGKTTGLRLAAAAFGCPDASDPKGSVIFQLSGTSTFNERRTGILHNLALFMDESKSGNLKELSKFAYMLAGGTSKGRGTVDSVQKTTHFETIGIFTGEEPIVSAAKSGGANVRVATFFGSPFGEESAAIGAFADEINEVVSENYGHAVRVFLDYLFEQQCEWSAWRRNFVKYKKQFKKLADEQGNKYVARLAPTLAAIKLCEKLVQRALKIPSIDVVEQTWHNFAVETSVADQSRLALEYVYNFYVGNRDKFWSGSKKVGAPPNGWIGKADFSGIPSAADDLDFSRAYLGFMPRELERILKDAEFDANAVIRQWKLDDLLLCDEGRNTYQVGLDAGRPRLVALRKSAIDDLVAGDDSEDVVVEDDLGTDIEAHGGQSGDAAA